MSDLTAVFPTRRIRMTGPANLRDLGGYATSSGETVRWRRAFRSDSLASMNRADTEQLATELGVRTVIDLRTAAEIEHAPSAALGTAPFRYHHVPLIDETCSLDPVFFPGVALHDLYLSMLRKSGERIAAVMKVLSRSAEPAVFFCSAGKDRTGLVAALLLGTLGVSDEDIALDYALTAEVMPRIMERARRWSTEAGSSLSFPPQVYGAEADTMREVLSEVRREHGSVLGYMLDAGLDMSEVEALRGFLRE